MFKLVLFDDFDSMLLSSLFKSFNFFNMFFLNKFLSLNINGITGEVDEWPDQDWLG